MNFSDPNRSWFRWLLSAVICVPVMFAGAAETSGSAVAARPNILFLFADDMRAETIHALGNDEIHTPHLDALAASGMAFPHAYIMGAHGGAVCVASRAMLLTGRSLHHLKKNGSEIPEDNVMLGRLLSSLGYQTYGIGKWHNGTDTYMRCFDDGDEIMFGGMVGSQYKVPLNHYHKDGVYEDSVTPNEDANQFQSKISDHYYKDRHSSKIFADAAIKFLDDKRTSKPFFLYVAFTAPHDPRQSPKEFSDMYDTSEIALPDNFMPEHPFDNGHMRGRDEMLLGFPRKPDEVKSEIKDYYAIISHLDSQVGRIVDSLKKSGAYDNTIIIFAGDNGLALGQHGLMGKQSVYEHTVGVPMIWSGPGVAKNKKSAAYCYLTDIYPTLCDILDVKAPDTVDGKSFAECLDDSDKEFRQEMYFGFRNLHRAVSDRRYKLIEYNVKGVRHTQLFDLENDPAETKNLADVPELAPVRDRLRKKLLEHRAKSGDAGSKFWEGF